MAFITDYQYYYNEGNDPQNTNHGSYQYTSLEDIVKNFMQNYTGNNSLIRNEPRHKIIFHAKQAIKELNMDAMKEIKIMEIDVNDELSLVMPHDYVNWVRISLYENGVLYPLQQNKSTAWSNAYLKDNNDQILFDEDGYVLLAERSQLEEDRINNTHKTGYLGNSISGTVKNADLNTFDRGMTLHFRGFPGTDTSLANVNPTFRVNKKAGTIEISSDGAGKKYVVEYVSDGMENNDDSLISVNKMFEKYIYAEIRFQLLDNKLGVQEYIVNRARKRRKAEYNNASIRMMDLSPSALLMSLRGQQNWVK